MLKANANMVEDGLQRRYSLLVGPGADIEARGGRDGWTPLIAAAHRGKREVVECLLDGYPKWAGVTEEIQEIKHLVGNIISHMIAVLTRTTSFVHGECSVLVVATCCMWTPPQSSAPWLSPPN
jgi:hypothetical protein